MEQNNNGSNRAGAAFFDSLFKIFALAILLATIYLTIQVDHLGWSFGVSTSKNFVMWMVLGIGLIVDHVPPSGVGTTSG